MTRVYVKRPDCPTNLTWQEKYPTSYLYSSPAEIDHLKRVLEDERRTARPAAPQPSARQAGS